MAKKRIQIKDNRSNEFVEGIQIKIIKAEEPFIYISLEDGTELTVRTTINRVARLIDKWSDDGNPEYILDFSTSIMANSPDNLRKT